jgi:putative hydrolase of the HAD superfamily
MKLQLFFDLDRTLWDFEKNSQNALKYLFEQTINEHQFESFHRFLQVYKEENASLWKKYGKGKITKEQLRTMRFEKTFFKMGLNNKELIQYFSDEYIAVSPLQKQLFPHTIETLEALKKEGYRMHIITNGFKEVQQTKLDNCNLTPYFEHIISSEEIGINKPDYRIFNYALQLAQSKAQDSVMIGDDINVDIIGAERAGMHAIHFDPEKRIKRSKQDTRINDLAELPQILPWIQSKWENNEFFLYI